MIEQVTVDIRNEPERRASRLIKKLKAQGDESAVLELLEELLQRNLKFGRAIRAMKMEIVSVKDERNALRAEIEDIRKCLARMAQLVGKRNRK